MNKETIEERAELYSTMTMFYNPQSGEIPTEKEIMNNEYVAEIAFKAGAEWMKEQMETLKDFDTWKEWKNNPENK